MKRTILVVAVAVVALGLVSLANAAPTYIGAEKCKMCHKVQYESWLAKGTHSKALEKAKAATNMKFDASCLACHATNKDEALPGVQCEACHGAGSDYKSMSIMKDVEKAKAAGLVVPVQATCDGCHDGKDHHKKIAFTRDVHDHKK
jgi:DnaJ-class molecular chaperone